MLQLDSGNNHYFPYSTNYSSLPIFPKSTLTIESRLDTMKFIIAALVVAQMLLGVICAPTLTVMTEEPKPTNATVRSYIPALQLEKPPPGTLVFNGKNYDDAFVHPANSARGPSKRYALYERWYNGKPSHNDWNIETCMAVRYKYWCTSWQFPSQGEPRQTLGRGKWLLPYSNPMSG